PEGIAVGPNGALYIADTKNNVVRRLLNGVVTTIAGFSEPSGVTCDEAGNVYVTDAHSIHRIASNGEVVIIAGSRQAGLVDGLPASALFRSPGGSAFAGALYVADSGNDAIRRIDAAVSIASIDPRFGAAAGGTEVHVIGSGFVPGATS